MASGVTDPSSFLHNASLCLPHLPSRVASVTLSLFYTVLLVFSALGNVLALCLACQKDKKINSTDVYLAHLAVSDLLFTLALPGKITYYALDFSWPFGDWLCRLTAFVFFVNTYGGLYIMTCVSVDRYLAVVRSQRCPRVRNAGRARFACVVVWALASLQTLPLLFSPMTTPVADKLTCMEYVSVERILALPLMVLVACCVCFCGPVGIILFCYVKITLKLWRTARENPLASRKGAPRRACLLTVVLLVAVVVCFSPYHLNIIQFMGRELLRPASCPERRAFQLSLQITVSFMNVSCCTDPIIYFFASKGYRKWLLSILQSRVWASSSSPGKASSETPSISQTAGNVPLAENRV